MTRPGWRQAQAFIGRARQLHFVRHVSAMTAGQVAMGVLIFVQGILVARWLGPQDFGVAALIMSYPALLYGMLDARSSAATVKFVSEFAAKRDGAAARAMCRVGYLVDLGIGVLTIGLVGATAWWAESHIIKTPGTAGLLMLYTLAFLPRGLTGTSRSALTVLGRFREVAWAEVLAKFISVTAVLSLVLAGWGVVGVVVGQMVGMTTVGILLSVLAARRVRAAWGGGWLGAPWSSLAGHKRTIARFLMFTELTEFVGLIGKQADMVILGFFAGPLEAGYYRLAKKLTGVVNLLVQPFQAVLFPRVAKQWGAGRRAELHRTVKRYALWLSGPVAMLIIAGLPLLPWFIEVSVGPSYLPAAIPSQLLMAGSAAWLAFSWLRPLLHTIGAVKFLLGWSAVTNGLCVLGFVFAAARWGAVGTAVVWFMVGGLLGHLLLWGYYWVRVRPMLDGPPVRHTVPPVRPVGVAVEEAS